MQFKLRLLTAVAFLLVACGGGGSSNGPLSSSTVDAPTSGIVVDGYLAGSTVSCDVDRSGLPGVTNLTADALTDSGGRYTFSKGCSSGLIVTGGQDQDTKLAFNGVLRAPFGATVVSPVSTLIAALVATGKSVADSQDLVNKSLGLDINTDLLNTDPAAIRTVTRTDADGKQTVTTLYNNLALYKANLTVQQLIQSTTEIIVAKGNADTGLNSYAATALALATTLANPLLSDTRPLNTEVLTTFIANAVPNSSNVNIVADEISKLVQGIADTSKVTPDQITAEVVKVAEISTSKANALAQILQSDAESLPEALKALTTTTTTTTTTTATTTTTTYAPLLPSSPNNFLYLANDSVSFDDGLGASSSITSYTLTQFQTGAGIPVQWPLNNAAVLKFTLADGGAFSVPSGQTYSAALSITDTDSTAQVRAYVDSITLSKTGTDITASIPSSAAGRVYLKSVDGTESLCAWASCGGGAASTTMSTDSGGSIALGQIINKAVNTLSSFTPKSGKYAVTLVVSGLPMTKADRVTLLPTYAVSVPNGTANPVLVVGTGFQGYITVTNNNIPPTTSTSTTTTTTTTTTTASSTTTTLAPWLSYLTLVNDTLNYHDGTTSTPYTLAQFQALPGILVKWPMVDAAFISFTLTETGTYAPLSTLPLTAALSLTDTSTGSAAKIKAYIDNVKVTRGADNSISITIPSSANALVYGLTRDGTQAVLVPVSNLVSGVNNKLGTGSNTVEVGSVINNAVRNAGSSFTGVNALTGTYVFTLLVTDLPLRQANGTAFPVTTITVPTSLSGSSVRTVTGAGLTGFVTLAP